MTLWFALSTVLAAGSPAAPRSFMTAPTIHGDSVVFTAEGDLWKGNLKSGDAFRLTTAAGLETNARISPDGSMVAFNANYDGQNEVYVMPVEGGEPARLTFATEGLRVQGWSADGKDILFASNRGDNGLAVPRLWRVPAAGGMATPLPIPRAEFGTMGPDGRVAYVPISRDWMNWYGYRAGSNDQLWLADLKGGFSRLTNFVGVDTHPAWIGNDVVFASERSGNSNLFRVDLATKKVTQLTFGKSDPVQYPSSDGNRVVFTWGTGIGLYDPVAKTTSPVRFRMMGDRTRARTVRAALASVASNVSLGPTAKRVLIEARGQIASVPIENGDMRVVEATGGARATQPAWAPDGKRFAFVSDRTGEYEVWLGDATGAKAATQLTKGLGGFPKIPVWSPDGKWIGIADRTGTLWLVDAATGTMRKVDQATGMGSYDGATPNFDFSPDSAYLTYDRTETNWSTAVYLYEIATQKKARLSHEAIMSMNPVFTTDGKFVAYLVENNMQPTFSSFMFQFTFANTSGVRLVSLGADTASPLLAKNDEEGGEAKPPAKPVVGGKVKVDWDGLQDRWTDLTTPPSQFGALLAVPGRLLVLAGPPARGLPGNPEIRAIDLNSGRITTLGPGGGFAKNFDGTKVVVFGEGGFSVNDAAAPVFGAPPVNLGPYAITVNPEAEWRQIFGEAWRACRDFFYDKGLHGVDWMAVRKKYEAQLPMVGDRSDLTALLARMMSELQTGHCYVVGPGYTGPVVPMGYLGAGLEAQGDALRITKLYAGDGFRGSRSPLLEPGLNVKVGDFILEINGKPVSKDRDPQALLMGTVGQTIAIVVNSKPTREGARTIRIKPLASERALRYTDWVESRREYVRKNGGPEFGYVHMSDMSGRGLTGFMKGHYSQIDKKAMVYDFRFNGGGNVSSLVLQQIAAKPFFYFGDRYGQPWTRESWANIGHKVALCNEDSFSDGELVIETWKRMKVGPVIGKRTGGGEVGSGGGYGLADGGEIFVPAYAAYDDGKWIIEGVGAQPDIDLDQDPAAVMAGRDPQLDKAIAVLREALSKRPIRPLTVPPPKKIR